MNTWQITSLRLKNACLGSIKFKNNIYTKILKSQLLSNLMSYNIEILQNLCLIFHWCAFRLKPGVSAYYCIAHKSVTCHRFFNRRGPCNFLIARVRASILTRGAQICRLKIRLELIARVCIALLSINITWKIQHTVYYHFNYTSYRQV